ncbi:alpha-L-fucosidase [Sphingobacterium composti Ten et al. 2007 non Yoo et al. 2007]|uniref:alpha-L-fucosidase n=1 Tax=Sphingobacterium composti TaxID=363260 RepID=UPI00135B2346|nr:alpha-L-fucosidase [Sphingobacterium composti Ten et al. 2007 non Yoo et al. 2007]
MKTISFLLANGLFMLQLHAQEAPKPYGVLPSERQLKWHEMETYCLIHYTPTTFQDKEWGLGDADPKIFNPSNFDANQIAQAAASAGFKGLISVAKHHDGFCLWPTRTTTYSIASSPWKNGKGDMVKEFMEASHKNGMAFGTYLSAWDRNDLRYGTPAYTDAYREQLTELMTNYGQLFTSWHDGANGGDGYYGGKYEKRTINSATYYEWEEKTWPIIRRLQPMASIFSDVGPDMRWVGNEHGFAAETSWATITPKGAFEGVKPMPGASTDASNLPTGTRNGKYWIPAECDVPQRPGWFYHKNQDSKVKTPNQLFEIYLKSVGRGANMNLGLAPMPEGILHPNDVKSLKYFGKKIERTFADNLAKGAKATSKHLRGKSAEFTLKNIFDDDRYSYYAPKDNILSPEIEITLDGEKEFDLIRIRENIKLGQRLDSVVVDTWNGGKWVKLASATSIGANRLIKLEQPTKATKLKVKLYSPVVPTLSDFALFKEYDEAFEFDENVSSSKHFIKSSYTAINTSLSLSQSGSVSTIKGNGFEIKLNEPISAFGYLPRQDGVKDGFVLKYEIQASEDQINWTTIKEGEFSNILSNPIEQIVEFDKQVSSKYLKFVAKDMTGFTFGELNIYK